MLYRALSDTRESEREHSYRSNINVKRILIYMVVAEKASMANALTATKGTLARIDTENFQSISLSSRGPGMHGTSMNNAEGVRLPATSNCVKM